MRKLVLLAILMGVMGLVVACSAEVRDSGGGDQGGTGGRGPGRTDKSCRGPESYRLSSGIRYNRVRSVLLPEMRMSACSGTV